MTILNSINYDYRKYNGEIYKFPSLTIPDQSMTVRDILERHSRGLTIESAKVPIYEEENLPDIKNMDLADREQYAEYAKQEIARIKGKQKPSDKIIDEERIDVLEEGKLNK